MGEPPFRFAAGVETFQARKSLPADDGGAACPHLPEYTVVLSAMPAPPVTWIEMAAADAHRQGSPDYGFNMHAPRKFRRSELFDEPVKPFDIHRASPLADANIDVVRQGNARIHRSLDNLRRPQATRPLPHEQDAPIRRRLEIEAIGEIEIGVEQNHFVGVIGQQKRVGNLPPTRVAAAKIAQMDQIGKSAFLQLIKVGRAIDRRPVLGASGFHCCRNRIGQHSLVIGAVGNEGKMNRLDGISEKAVQRKIGVGQGSRR